MYLNHLFSFLRQITNSHIVKLVYYFIEHNKIDLLINNPIIRNWIHFVLAVQLLYM